MHVASLELCKELHELSGWRDTELIYARNGYYEPIVTKANHPELGHDWALECAAYDLGYLMQKLPKTVKHPATGDEHTLGLSWHLDRGQWVADYERSMIPHAYANTPEDAVTKVCIELIKAGLLKQQEGK